jgi:hypothetical protein
MRLPSSGCAFLRSATAPRPPDVSPAHTRTETICVDTPPAQGRVKVALQLHRHAFDTPADTQCHGRRCWRGEWHRIRGPGLADRRASELTGFLAMSNPILPGGRPQRRCERATRWITAQAPRPASAPTEPATKPRAGPGRCRRRCWHRSRHSQHGAGGIPAVAAARRGPDPPEHRPFGDAGGQLPLPDYATTRRREEPISTASTENTVQWLLHRRMNAQQQMCWSPRGARSRLI